MTSNNRKSKTVSEDITSKSEATKGSVGDNSYKLEHAVEENRVSLFLPFDSPLPNFSISSSYICICIMHMLILALLFKIIC